MDPQFRTFCDLKSLSASYWDAAGLHLNANGTAVAGGLAFGALMARPPVNAAKWQTRTTDGTRTRSNTVTLADDEELRFYLEQGKAYRLQISIIGITTTSAGFKWGVSGPAANVIACKAISTAQASSPVVDAFVGSYPNNKVVSANGYFWLDVDLFITNLTASGEAAFRWAQYTASAGNTRVMASSFMEAIEI
jgi:hypothetical protein